MIENLKKKVFHLFLGISLKRRLFITYLLLSSLILMLTSVFFYTASKKVLIKRAALSSQQQLSLITSNLGEKIDNISNYAITLSINSNIADVLKENPTVPENTLEHFLVNSELTDQAQRIIGLHKNIYAWDILDTENHWFHSSRFHHWMGMFYTGWSLDRTCRWTAPTVSGISGRRSFNDRGRLQLFLYDRKISGSGW